MKLKGFTLIELLVVMFIIGLLASLVIVNVSSSRKTARDTKRMSDLKTIQGALEMYNNKNGSYPITFTSDINNVPPAYRSKYGTDAGGATSGCPPGMSCLTGTIYGGYSGLCGDYNFTGSKRSQDIFDATGTLSNVGWIPGLAPNFLSVLPQDPKPNSNNTGCYIYRSTGSDYIVVAKSMETICGSGADDTCNPVSIQEMDRPTIAGNDIAVYTLGARGW